MFVFNMGFTESLKIIVNSLSAVSIPSSVNLQAVEITTSETVGATGAKSGDVERLKTSLRSLYEDCQNNDKNTDTDDARKKRRNANLIAGAAGTAVLGALGAGITGSVLQAKYENAANDAVKQWYEEIGEHIQCYLGNEELGSYGDVVTFDID